MSKAAGLWTARVCSKGVLPCVLLLLGAVTLFYVALAPAVLWLHGIAGLRPAATAALVSMLVGVVVLAVTHQPALRKRPLVSLLLATSLRMVPLLAIVVVVALPYDERAYDERGHFDFACYMVLFYIATLAVETYASVQLAQLAQNPLPHTQEMQA